MVPELLAVASEVREGAPRQAGSHARRRAATVPPFPRRRLQLPEARPFRSWSKASEGPVRRFQTGDGRSNRFQTA